MITPNHLSTPLHILVGEDEPEIRDYLQLALRRPDFVVDFAEDGEEVLNALARGVDTPDLVILDVVMPRKDGITTLREIRHQNRSLPIIMLSGVSSATHMGQAMEYGANNFLTKPVSHQELRQAVDLLLPSNPATRAVKRADVFGGKLELNLKAGDWIRKMDPLLKRLAACDVPILLQGETGVGKEVLARHIHNQSLRSGKIFLKLNCAALPPNSWKANCSVTSGVLSLAHSRARPASLSWRMEEPSFSMRSVTWISDFRPNYCKCFKIANFIESEQKRRHK